jgi:hypothetical protein
MKKHIYLLISISLIISLYSCDKESDFLDAKPNQALVIPTTIGDYERLLNEQSLFNRATDLSLGTSSADEYYLPDQIYISLLVDYYRNIYKWASLIDQGGLSETYANEWNKAYKQIFICNVVLEGMDKLTESERSNTALFNAIKGRAYFFRAWAFYNLVQTFALPYNSATAESDLGVPLRLVSDINIKSTRATVQACYDQVLSDIDKASSLLPEKSDYKTHPSGIAALGFLSRIYLAMGKYDLAFDAANLFFSKYKVLTDYNTLPATRTSSIHTTFIDEDVFHVSIASGTADRRDARIFKSFYDLYHADDLRKTRYFRVANDEVFFKGSYDYSGNHFSGIATDEIYLNRAECYARKGETQLALDDLNHLLKNRWNPNKTYTPIEAQSADDALNIILQERRKELLFRGVRWTDLRRLNQEPRFQLTLTRSILGVDYSLPPNDLRYAMPIPSSEIELSNLQQNQR